MTERRRATSPAGGSRSAFSGVTSTSGPIGERTFEKEFLAAGVEAFSFTFG
jgi:hypothetical protein